MNNSGNRRGGLPAPLKWIILAVVGLSLFAALFDVLFPKVGLPNPIALFSLSPWGIKHFFYWQFFTHFFLINPQGGLSILFLFNLFISCYMLYMIGLMIIGTRGVKDFLTLFLGGGIISGLAGYLLLSAFGTPGLIIGTSSALYALLTAWMMINPNAQVLVFFAIPLRIKWLISGLLAFNFLVDISNGNFLSCTQLTSSVLFSYLFCLLKWKMRGPYQFLNGFEEWLLRSFESRKRSHAFTNAKIYDFKTGEAILSDDEFVDECLSKIAQKGKKSLSFKERWKLRRISKRKQKQS
ncbi:MAG: rhomboid family intramembrane serine protease [Simkaniaceae bacterium]|nr:rhomboid family intramembrane serine protease [Simkaniaceae bacterium]